MAEPARHSVLGYPLDAVTLPEAVDWVLDRAQSGAKVPPALVVTLNPEIVVQATQDPALARALQAADLSVADGVGVAWAARRAGVNLPGRVPGVDLATEAMRAGAADLSVYFLGARPGVAERAAQEARQRYGIVVAGSHHGYFDKSDAVEVIDMVSRAGPDLLLAGLGEGQERFLHEHRETLGAAVLIGVGGTLDVLAGEVKRMPAWTTRLGVEWLFRVLLDRRRWGRLPRLFRFAALVLSGRSVA